MNRPLLTAALVAAVTLSGCSAVQEEAGWLANREAEPTRGNADGVDGNARFYGAEVMYDGGQPMTSASPHGAAPP